MNARWSQQENSLVYCCRRLQETRILSVMITLLGVIVNLQLVKDIFLSCFRLSFCSIKTVLFAILAIDLTKL